jgi:hypothetical protein
MTTACGLFDSLRTKGEDFVQAHLKQCPECAAQIDADTMLARFFLPPPLPTDKPILAISSKAHHRRALPISLLAFAIAVVLSTLILARFEWTPFLIRACGLLSILLLSSAQTIFTD